MDLNETPGTRRRGTELEDALLDAAWGVLVDHGYPGFTFESVAARAGTSRPVLYRRWPTRDDLLAAALKHSGMFGAIEVPDTGTLRSDAIGLLQEFGRQRIGVAALMSVLLSDLYRESGTTFAEARSKMLDSGAPRGFQVIVDRAVARGELDLGDVPDRVLNLPADLFRHELMLTLSPIPVEVIEEIVDDIWLPLLGTYARRQDS